VNIDQPLTLVQLREVYERPAKITLTPASLAQIDKGAAAIAKIVDSGVSVYGVNTGFGLLANTSIARHDLEDLQRNLVLSHACGVGPLLSDQIVRLILVLKTVSLARDGGNARAPHRGRDLSGHSVQGLRRCVG
jgi:histidine ammonia-lyase